jgi:hypothetical protein
VLHSKGNSVPVTSIETRRGPRHILFVVETGKQVPADAKRVGVISEILAKADSGDSFALITTRGPRSEVRFGAAKEVIAASAKEVQKDLGAVSQKEWCSRYCFRRG